MFLVHNERTKLTASWLKTLATALVAAGVFAPAAALMYGVSRPVPSTFPLLLLTVGCFAGAVVLHVLGWLALGRLRE
jgi:ABC-type multidrug transport system permease subunit